MASLTFNEVKETIGREATIWLGGLEIVVVVKDYKQSYGKDRWQVTPKSGTGLIWVESLDLIEPPLVTYSSP